MTIEVRVPSPGESISEVELATWTVKTGDLVHKDQELALIESDKATLPLMAPEAGKIEILVTEGEMVKVDSVACKIDTSVEVPDEEAIDPDVVDEKIEKEKEEIKEKEITDINKDCFVADKSAIKTKDLEFRKNEFKNNLEPFLEIYGKVLLNDFFRYWTETNQGGKKMRFEMERVFEISKRLKTWSNNENKFKKAGGMSEREKRLEGVAQLKADAAAILEHLNIKLS